MSRAAFAFGERDDGPASLQRSWTTETNIKKRRKNKKEIENGKRKEENVHEKKRPNIFNSNKNEHK
jgi:hypothetical protein